jgi:hypothetical protein
MEDSQIIILFVENLVFTLFCYLITMMLIKNGKTTNPTVPTVNLTIVNTTNPDVEQDTDSNTEDNELNYSFTTQ